MDMECHMKKYQFSLIVVIISLWLATLCHSQERRVANQTAEPPIAEGSDVKKDSKQAAGGIIDALTAQKEKYQKDIQDQIQNKVKSVEDKFNALKSLAGKAEPEKPAKQETASTPVQADKEGAEKTPAQAAGQTANSGSGFWGKLNALQEATMAFLKQLMTILFK
jgi:hypothetical protein